MIKLYPNVIKFSMICVLYSQNKKLYICFFSQTVNSALNCAVLYCYYKIRGKVSLDLGYCVRSEYQCRFRNGGVSIKVISPNSFSNQKHPYLSLFLSSIFFVFSICFSIQPAKVIVYYIYYLLYFQKAEKKYIRYISRNESKN